MSARTERCAIHLLRHGCPHPWPACGGKGMLAWTDQLHLVTCARCRNTRQFKRALELRSPAQRRRIASEVMPGRSPF